MSGASIWTGNTTQVSTANADNTKLEQRFAPTEGQSVFVLTNFSYAVGTHSLEVFINGVRQSMGVDFTETSSSSFTVTGGVEATDVIDATGIVGTSGATLAAASASAAGISATAAAASAAQAALFIPANLPLSIANGGSGQISRLLGFNALSPATSKGDLVISDGANNIRLAVGANGQALMADSTAPAGAKWGNVGIGSGAAIVANTTLTIATMGYHAINMASLGLSVTLPDATTVAFGGPRAILDNTKGLYPVGVRDSTGTLICAIAAGGEGIVFARDVSTAAGVWSVTGSGVEISFISSDVLLSTTYGTSGAANINPAFVSLDANTSIHFVLLTAGGFAAVVVDNLGKVISTPVAVAGSTFYINNVFKISATSALVVYGVNAGGSAANHKAVVISLTGASPSLSLSVGTAVSYAISLNALAGEEQFAGIPKIAQLTPTLYLVVSCAGTSAQAFVFSVAGTVITAGASIALGSGTNDLMTVFPVTATTGFVFWLNGTDVSMVVVSVAGTTCSIPAITNLLAEQTGGVFPSISQVAANQFISATDNVLGATANYIRTILVTGTVITYSAQLTSVQNGDTGYLAGGATRQTPHLAPLTATTVLLWTLGSGFTIITVGAGTTATPTEGTQIVGGQIDVGFKLLRYSATEFITGGIYSTNNNFINTFKITGNVISFGPAYRLTTDGSGIMAAKVSQGDTAILGNISTSLDLVRTTGDFITRRGTLAVPPFRTTISGISYLAPVSSNRIVLLGGMKAAGGLFQNRLLNVEIAA